MLLIWCGLSCFRAFNGLRLMALIGLRVVSVGIGGVLLKCIVACDFMANLELWLFGFCIVFYL